MEKLKTATLTALVVTLVSLTAIATEYKIPVIVNQVGTTDTSGIDDAIKGANEILDGHVELERKPAAANADPCSPTNGDNNLTDAETDILKDEGKEELGKVLKDEDGNWTGKGIKIYVADDCWVEEPNCAAWAWHYDNCICIEPNSTPEELARTLAHEVGHNLTWKDTYDPNDKKYVRYGWTDGGTEISPEDVNEIGKRGPVIGTATIVDPNAVISPDPNKPPTKSPSKMIGLNAAILDELGDLETLGIIDTTDRMFAYTDIHHITLNTENIALPESQVIIYINLNGVFPGTEGIPEIERTSNTPRTFNSFFTIDVGDAALGKLILVNVTGDGSPTPEATAHIADNTGMNITVPVKVIGSELHINNPDKKIVFNHVLEIYVPTDFFIPDAMMPDGTIPISAMVSTTDDLAGPDVIMDFTEPFNMRISNPHDGAGMYLSPPAIVGITGVQIVGHGLTPNTEIEIALDDMPIGTAITDIDGNFIFLTGPTAELVKGTNYVITVQEMITSAEGDFRGETITAKFLYSDETVLEGDIDKDGDVDMDDFAKLAENWLVGTF